MKRISLLSALCSLLLLAPMAHATTVVATVNNTPITDADVTARVRLMNLQGQSGTDNRIRALENIIDDSIKMAHTSMMNIVVSDADVNSEIQNMRTRGLDTSGLNPVGMEMLHSAVRANIAWQMMIGRVVMPTMTITDEDIAHELAELSRTRGLPIEITIIRLVDIPADVARRLTRPRDCDDAVRIARNLGGYPIRLTAPEFELSEEIRARIANLETLTWSARAADNSVIMVCNRVNMPEFSNLDEIIRQNATWRRAINTADQQLRNLRRRTVIVIHDDRYRGAI